MTKILVLSDSHGAANLIRVIVEQELPFDELIFCGDGIKDLEAAELPKKFTITAVSGNVDRLDGRIEDESCMTEMDGTRIFVSHGDRYLVKETLRQITDAGTRMNADLVLFGHTHDQYFSRSTRPALLNPGSVKNGCYATVSLNEGSFKCSLKVIA